MVQLYWKQPNGLYTTYNSVVDYLIINDIPRDLEYANHNLRGLDYFMEYADIKNLLKLLEKYNTEYIIIPLREMELRDPKMKDIYNILELDDRFTKDD